MLLLATENLCRACGNPLWWYDLTGHEPHWEHQTIYGNVQCPNPKPGIQVRLA